MTSRETQPAGGPDEVEIAAADVAADVAPTAPPTGLRHAVRAFRNRDFAIFWWGALASNTGTWVQNLAIPFVLYELTTSALWVGLATFAQFVPAMVLGPLAGSIADRFDRRRVLLVPRPGRSGRESADPGVRWQGADRASYRAYSARSATRPAGGWAVEFRAGPFWTGH